jgi:hypothetical protein
MAWDRTSEDLEMEREALNFYRIAFNREPTENDEYFKEWLHRFRTGHPESFMDLERKTAFIKMKGLDKVL